jgi:hypothetical protein
MISATEKVCYYNREGVKIMSPGGLKECGEKNQKAQREGSIT